MWLTEGYSGNYAGYQAGNDAFVNFPQGFLLNDNALSGSGVGTERLVDAGVSVPTGTFHQIGDIHFNQDVTTKPHPFMAWIDTYAYFSNISAAVIAGTTTSVPIAGCPSPALPAGTPIIDNTITPVAKFIGSLASCISGTLTFQAPAANNANSGDELVFMQWRAAAPVANDDAGTQWTLGNYMTLTPVALASLPATCNPGTFAVISDGVASPTYNAAVGATTGAATDPQFLHQRQRLDVPLMCADSITTNYNWIKPLKSPARRPPGATSSTTTSIRSITRSFPTMRRRRPLSRRRLRQIF